MRGKPVQKKKKIVPKESEYMKQLKSAATRETYLKNLINSRYYLARKNAIIEQLKSGEIEEKLDGRTKTEEYLRAELTLVNYQGITSSRNAYFAKKELIESYKFTDEDLKKIEDDYLFGNIIREDFDESYKKPNKAEFVKDT